MLPQEGFRISHRQSIVDYGHHLAGADSAPRVSAASRLRDECPDMAETCSVGSIKVDDRVNAPVRERVSALVNERGRIGEPAHLRRVGRGLVARLDLDHFAPAGREDGGDIAVPQAAS